MKGYLKQYVSLINNAMRASNEEIRIVQKQTTDIYVKLSVFYFICCASHVCKQASLTVAFVCIRALRFARNIISVVIHQGIIKNLYMKPEELLYNFNKMTYTSFLSGTSGSKMIQNILEMIRIVKNG